MGRYVHPSAQDACLSRIAEANQMHACTRQPANYADVANCSTASVTMAPADFVIEDGAASRVLRVMEKPGVSTAGGDDVDHVALVNTVEEVLLFVAIGNAVPTTTVFDFHEWFVELTNPVWNQ